jgi:hypothetical protein
MRHTTQSKPVIIRHERISSATPGLSDGRTPPVAPVSLDPAPFCTIDLDEPAFSPLSDEGSA